MPRRASSKKLVKDQERVLVQPHKSYQSLLYGVLTVFILFVVMIVGLRFMSQSKGTISDEGISTMRVEDINQPKDIYTVKSGDNLWSIAQNYYDDGYKWNLIAKANNIQNPNVINQGTNLRMPAVAAPTPTTIMQEPVSSQNPVNTPSENLNKISGNSYTVVRGDNLWNIAIRAYGDGYRWVDIARANHLANPDLIHQGNHFIIPR
ncbi:MAG TPA: LysM peptidoglycan-binding domain-containing protein [Patescibacteria group bacterium]|nr:LysM peptidoglycan-binding domain-containing protein [Patescibacteria group bacterium]